jgi:hypothetical protein
MSDLPGDDAATRRKAAQAAYQARWAAANPGYMTGWREKNSDKIAIYRARNAVRMAIWRTTPEGYAISRKSRIAYDQRKKLADLLIRPPVVRPPIDPKALAAAKHARQRERYHGDPLYNLKRRMSSAVRRSLQMTGGGSAKRWQSKWLTLVGYTAEELHGHIEKQFLPKMGWHNMPKWHVDHIVPLSSFNFSSDDDPEFRAAWALTNLRPVWATVNLRKRAKREHLL